MLNKKTLLQRLSSPKAMWYIYLVPPVLLALFLGVLYLPVLLGLDLPSAVAGAQVLFLIAVLRLFELSALVCGLAGLALNLRQLVSLNKMVRAVLLILLALGYIAAGGWFLQLEVMFSV